MRRLSILVVVLLILLPGCTSHQDTQGHLADVLPAESLMPDNRNAPSAMSTPALFEQRGAKDTFIRGSVEDHQIKVYFIDVGKGDCIFIHTPSNKTMLIDAGDYFSGNTVVSYLEDLGIQRIDVLVASHAHPDHAGGMSRVVKSFEVGVCYTPESSHSSFFFYDLKDALNEKDIPIRTIEAGTVVDFSEDVEVEALGPVRSEYSKFNDTSAVLKLTYGGTSFLFMGDAGSQAEKDMLERGYDLDADVLKVGHHGNMDATSPEFLQKVSPRYAVIQTGSTYPYKERMQKIKEQGIETFLNIETGTIIIISDGENITVRS